MSGNQMRKEAKVLVEVHLSAVRRWASSPNDSDRKKAQRLLRKIGNEETKYDRVVPAEGDFWEPNYNPDGATFSWDSVTGCLNLNDSIDISGAQKTLCVAKVEEELTKRGYKVRVREDLTIELDN